jgi:hypothetical protein
MVELTEDTDDRFASDLILGKVHLDMFFGFVFGVRLQVWPTGQLSLVANYVDMES